MGSDSGVVTLPVSSPLIGGSIKKAVDDFIKTLSSEDNDVLGYEIGISTEKGVNAAVAFRVQDEQGNWKFETGLYVGKHWGAPLDTGVFVRGKIKLK